jgi:pimeloyl-ACP methyl ester carboxylesterase
VSAHLVNHLAVIAELHMQGRYDRMTDNLSQLPDLAGLLPTIRTPVLIIAGQRNHIVPLVNAEFLLERLPASKLALLDVGHYTWEDASTEYATLVTGWWSRDYATVSD